jgi:transcriptional regulator with PAS, ATPase and Fis domain
MITGESGTGKELFSHAIHNASPRSHASFIRVNCASVPHDLFESEFFGYEEGAFTGARSKGMKGKFQLADRGTIFLDEVSEIPIYLQAKLLRVIQEKEVQRIGSDRVMPIDFRIIASTNRDLSKMVANGEFREDLYYRLNVVEVNVPALRHRKEDLQILIPAFIEELNRKIGSKVEGMAPEALKTLEHYDWPGNVRELKNTMERAINLAQTGTIQIKHLPHQAHSQSKSTPKSDALPLTLKEATDQAEVEAIKRALLISGGRKVKAARILGIHRSALYKKMHNLGLATKS